MAIGVDDPRYVRTTVSIREDLYQRIKREGLTLSEAVNEALAKQYKKDHSMFGTAKRSPRDDIRDRIDRTERR